MYLEDTLFHEAFDLYQKAQTDPRVLISLFPELDPSFKQSIPKIGRLVVFLTFVVQDFLAAKYPNIIKSELESFEKGLIEEAKKCLLGYLVTCRNSPLGLGRREEIDTALLQLYLGHEPKKLYKLLESENYCKLDVCERLLLDQHVRFLYFILLTRNTMLRAYFIKVKT